MDVPVTDVPNEATTAHAKAECERMREEAKDKPTPTCVFCHQPVFFYEWVEGLIEGHVYSEAGVREVRQSGICEFCYDDTAEKFDSGQFHI